MAKTKTRDRTLPEDLEYPVTFEVTNTGKRHRFRGGRNILAAKGNDKPKAVEITVANRAEYLRLKGCKDLQLKPTKAKSGGGSTSGGGSRDPLVDEHTSEQLQEMAKERELATTGTKAELAARIREHDEAAGSGGGDDT